MKRRTFLSLLGANVFGIGISGSGWAMGEKQSGENYGIHPASKTVVDELAGMSLTQLREFHRKELEDNYLPTWDDRKIDREYGGYLPYLNKDGSYKSTDKEMYYQARGVWVFSYVYNHFGKNEKYLDAARRGKEFLFKFLLGNNFCWNSKVTREGKFLEGSYNIYGDMYAALGLAEYYKATGDKESLEAATKTAFSISDRIVSPVYQHLYGHGAGHEPGTKRLGTWQHFLSVLTPLARLTGDYGIEMLAGMCVRNIMERHWRPEYGVFLEHLDDQFQPFRTAPLTNHRMVSGWHSIQASWMCMDEALRIGHAGMFMDAMEMGRKTLHKCWDDAGGLLDCDDPGMKPKIPPEGYCRWSALDDGLVFTLLAIEHTHAPWAIAWFNKIYSFIYKNPERIENEDLLHHPRRLFFAIDMLDHMIQRNGRVSDFLSL